MQQDKSVDVVTMSDSDIEQVSGGILPFLAGVALGFAVAAAADYLNGGFND